MYSFLLLFPVLLALLVFPVIFHQVEAITKMVAFPDKLNDTQYLLNESAAAIQSIGENMYFNTYKNFQRLSAKKNFQKLGKPVDKTGLV